jgi:alkyl sulfatase BDS1-like metallo-beta-lactamase superfamily hydrolase
MDLGAETILYGHHGPVVGKALIKTELTALRDAILYVHDETVKGMNAGLDVHTLMAEIQLPAELEVGQGYGKVSWSVRAIWENYAGWFKHASTTELYAQPQSVVHQDLIELAGGPEAIAAHETLLDASENFWLSSWLKNQIKELQIDEV